jgi:hypothetical protein
VVFFYLPQANALCYMETMPRTPALLLFILLGSPSFGAELKRPCLPPAAGEPKVGFASVSEGYQDLKTKFEALYSSGQRLNHRVYWDESEQSYLAETDRGLIHLPKDFLAHLQTHFALALARGYADLLFYSDLGHGHLLVPASKKLSFAMALASPSLKVLYHTAELLKMRDGFSPDAPLPQDPWLAWRYFSRNVLADNQTGENLAVLFAKPPAYNTVRAIEGYREIGTFLVSASKEGCFPYEQGGKTLYFDLAFRR